MSVKAILILCAQALLLKSALGQCTSRAAVADVSGLAAPHGCAAHALAAPYGLAAPAKACDGLAYSGAGFAGRGLAYDGLYGPALEIRPTSGGALPVTSASVTAPVGITVASDNAYEGTLTVLGELPFVSALALEGVVPSAGAGAVKYSCGNGRTAMISEATGFAPAAAMAPLAAYAPDAILAPAALAHGFDRHGAWAGKGCGCAL